LLDNGLVSTFSPQRIHVVTDELFQVVFRVRFASRYERTHNRFISDSASVRQSSFKAVAVGRRTKKSSFGNAESFVRELNVQLWSFNHRTREAEEVADS
jgi:hypothetical protein